MREFNGGAGPLSEPGSVPLGRQADWAAHLPNTTDWKALMHINQVATCQCPLCGAMAFLESIEPHHQRRDVEWRSFACRRCGPVKAVLVAKPIRKPPHVVEMRAAAR